MINRTTLFMFIYLLFFLEACSGKYSIIDTSTLSPEETVRVHAIKLMESNELKGRSFKVVEKVEGFSCMIYNKQYGVIIPSSRKKALEQTKINAMWAEGNAITNPVCFFEGMCLKCLADAVQVDCYE